MKLGKEWKNASISHSTFLVADIAPTILRVLRENLPENLFFCLEEEWISAVLAGKYSEEMWEFVYETLFDHMNSIAPEGCYFGSHPGDGSDLGFWEAESED